MPEANFFSVRGATFLVDLARKGARYAMTLSKSSGSSTPMLEISDRHLVVMKENLGE